MALLDLEVFIQERLQVFDPTIDVTPGGTADTQIVQPILQRLGTDPFTVDFITFAQDRLTQEYPDLALKEGDAITDLLIKTGMVLFDPLIRENTRIANAQSFRDPATLTVDEADALGANLFAVRNLGNVALGQGRIYYAQPQNASIGPANFFSASNGLHFFPVNLQSISPQEMVYNVEGTLYYFDVNLQAEQAGDAYNIDVDQLTSVANVTSAVRVTNKRRFRFGDPPQTAVDFVGSAEQNLSERSLVSLRGILTQITSAFTEVAQVAVVGAGDPQMNRDVLTGGGLGPVAAAGLLLHPMGDQENGEFTRRVTVDASESVNFITLIGPPGPVQGWTLTVHGGFFDAPSVRDLPIRAVVDARTLDLVDQVLLNVFLPVVSLPWVVRENALTLSNIPGGILFPDGPNGTVTIPNNVVHVGSATDVYLCGSAFDAATLVLSNISDNAPILQGIALSVVDTAGTVNLNDYVLGTTITFGDPTFLLFSGAYANGQSLDILTGPAAGTYRIVGAVFVGGNPVQLVLDPPPLNPTGTFPWSITASLTIDLLEPKEIRLNAFDLETVQGVNVITTGSGADFQIYGVSPGDTLRILAGPDVGDFKIVQVLTPFFTRLQLDKAPVATGANLAYTIFRPNAGGGLSPPLIRVDSIDILDTNGQPTGSSVPYARPIDIRSSSFANVSHGIKVDVFDAQLGIVTPKFGAGLALVGLTLQLVTPSSVVYLVTFTGTNPLTAAQAAAQINVALGARVAVVLDTDRIGIIPLQQISVVPQVGDAATVIWAGSLEVRAGTDVRSAQVLNNPGGWELITPPIDASDTLQILSGYQITFVNGLSPGVLVSGHATSLTAGNYFNPEIGVHLQVGSRSIGTLRLYFLDPTSAEVSFGSALFSATTPTGQVLQYFSDQLASYQLLPPLPNAPPLVDGATTASGVFTSAGASFLRSTIQQGDTLALTFKGFAGSVALADPVAGLALQTLALSIGGGPDQLVTFINDSLSIASTAVTRAGVISQINAVAGQVICSLDGSNHVAFDADAALILRSYGTANALLGFSASSDTNNLPLSVGTYTILGITATTLSVAPAFSVSETNLHYRVLRSGLQRITATQMATQQDVGGLYYFDVEASSVGTGDIYNIASQTPLTADGIVSDGYWLTTDDPDLTFSQIERPKLHLSNAILEVGVSDSPLNATQLAGQNLQVNYERSSLTANVQSFVTSETERVVCESALARHLIPYFVRFQAQYVGGAAESAVLTAVQAALQALPPSGAFNVSALEQIIQSAGASSVQNPIDLIAVIHNVDRTISVERSQNSINTGALAAFVPDVIQLTRLLS